MPVASILCILSKCLVSTKKLHTQPPPHTPHTHTHSCPPHTTHTAAPALPEGKELDASSTKRSAGLFSHLPSPDIGSIQTSSEDVEEIKRERDDPRNFRIPSLSVSESSGVIGHGIQIKVIDEDDEEEEINENTKLLIRPGKGDTLRMAFCIRVLESAL